MKKEKLNPLFVIAADNWRTQVMPLRKVSGYKKTRYTVKSLILEFGKFKIQDITKEMLQKYIVKLSETVSEKHIKDYIGIFKAIMQYADDDYDLPRRLKFPKRRQPKQEFYTFEEVRKMLLHSTGVERALIMLLAETGCRIGEALALQTLDILEGKISITKNIYDGIIQDTPKTDSSIREVHISKRLETELRKLCSRGLKDFVFRSPSDSRAYWPQTLTYELRNICYNAGVQYKSPHAFRRGNISALINEIGVPERIVGHRVGHLSSSSVTLGVYCKTLIGCDKIWVPYIERFLYEGIGGYVEILGKLS